MMIKKALVEDSKAATELALLLWPDNDFEELEKDIKDNITSQNWAIYLYFNETNPVGFVQCSLRNDYVEGTKSSPVGYLEGVYVKPEYRRKGIAKQLLDQGEEWAKGKGCSEFASDCEFVNTESLNFHLWAGFEEANRIICFKKKI